MVVDHLPEFAEKVENRTYVRCISCNAALCRPCLETRAITLAHAGTRANYFACVIYHTRKIASNVFFLLLLF